MRTFLDSKILNNENYPLINNLFDKNYINSINSLVLSKWDNENRSVFIHEDYQNINTNNTFPHFDKSRCFKFYICLNDMNNTNGCFKIVPNSLEKTKILRKKSVDKNVCKRGHLYYSGEDIEIESMLNVECKAGDMIIFDTNCIHAGGSRFENNKYRRVIRLHVLDCIFK